MREQFDVLKRGSDAYNQDIADTQWLVSMLKGVLEKYIDELPKGFYFMGNLYRESDDHPIWGIKFSLWDPAALSEKRAIDVVLQKVSGFSFGHVPWEDVKWTPFGPDMPVNVAKEFARNLDDLLTAALNALSRVSASKASSALETTMSR